MEHREINIKWSTLDVLAKAEEMGINHLSISEASIILDAVEAYHDASVGVNWDVISYHINYYIIRDGE